MGLNKANHTSTRREDWGTPKWLFDDLNEIFNFKLDLSAREDNALCKNFISPEANFFTYHNTEIDSLTNGGWSWCNPPYGRKGCKEWVEKLVRINNVVFLIPASVGAKWFEPVWRNADFIYFFTGRLTFEGAPSPAQFDSCLAIKGNATILQIFELRKMEKGWLVCP